MSEDAAQRMEAFRRRFVQRAAAERVRLVPLLDGLRAGDLPETERREIMRIAHGLAGAGGTFGFPAVSERAGRLEDLCLSDAGAADLASACEALVAELDRVA